MEKSRSVEQLFLTCIYKIEVELEFVAVSSHSNLVIPLLFSEQLILHKTNKINNKVPRARWHLSIYCTNYSTN